MSKDGTTVREDGGVDVSLKFIFANLDEQKHLTQSVSTLRVFVLLCVSCLIVSSFE